MILPLVRDPRLTLERRGGTLTDAEHRLLALWAAACADRVLPLFEASCPGDPAPRAALETIRAWAAGDDRVTPCKVAAYHANEAARGLADAGRFAAYAAGQAAATAHVAGHALGAAAYALRAVSDPVAERLWQREQLPEEVRSLVLADMVRRNELCWGMFGPV